MSLQHYVEENIAARGRHAFRAIVTLAAVVLLGVWQAGGAQIPAEAADAALRAFAGRIEALRAAA